MVCNFGTIPINKTKMQAANLILNGDNKVSQNKEYMYTLGHYDFHHINKEKIAFKKNYLGMNYHKIVFDCVLEADLNAKHGKAISRS